MTSNTLCYSYLRFSTAEQIHGHSQERQLGKSRKYAADNNLILVEELQDLGVSAWKGQGIDSALGRFKAAVMSGLIPPGSFLLIEEFDRLSRQAPMIANQQFFELLQHNIKIVTLNDSQVYTLESVTANPMLLMFALIKSITAAEHSDKLSLRLLEVYKKRRSTANNIKIKGQQPNWLRLEDNVFHKNIELCNAIEKMFELSIQGVGSYCIAQYLNDNIDTYPTSDIRRNTSKWSQSYIVRILNSRKVLGEFQPCKMENDKPVPAGEPIKNYYPAIVSEEVFNISRSKITTRIKGFSGPKGVKLTNMFSKLIKCECGSSFILKDSKYEKYLLCSNKNINNNCLTNSWVYDNFEKFIFQGLKELDIKSIFSVDKIMDKKSEINRSLDILNIELSKTTEEYNNLINTFLKVPPALLDDLIKLSETTKEKITGIVKWTPLSRQIKP